MWRQPPRRWESDETSASRKHVELSPRFTRQQHTPLDPRRWPKRSTPIYKAPSDLREPTDLLLNPGLGLITGCSNRDNLRIGPDPEPTGGGSMNPKSKKITSSEPEIASRLTNYPSALPSGPYCEDSLSTVTMPAKHLRLCGNGHFLRIGSHILFFAGALCTCKRGAPNITGLHEGSYPT